jgi:hypothetical protein
MKVLLRGNEMAGFSRITWHISIGSRERSAVILYHITWRSVHDEKSSKMNHTRISFVMIPRQIIREAILHDERKASRMFSEKQPIVSVT